jgi:hypothetical protein
MILNDLINFLFSPSEDDYEDKNEFLHMIMNPAYENFPCHGNTTDIGSHCKGCIYEEEHT